MKITDTIFLNIQKQPFVSETQTKQLIEELIPYLSEFKTEKEGINFVNKLLYQLNDKLQEVFINNFMDKNK